MASLNIGHSNNLITFGTVYPNLPVPPKASESSGPGNLLVNVSKAGRNICGASKQDLKTCGGETHIYSLLFNGLSYKRQKN